MKTWIIVAYLVVLVFFTSTLFLAFRRYGPVKGRDVLALLILASAGYFSLQYAVLLDLPYVSLEKEPSSTRLHERHDDDFSYLLRGIVFSHVLREEASIAATRQ